MKRIVFVGFSLVSGSLFLNIACSKHFYRRRNFYYITIHFITKMDPPSQINVARSMRLLVICGSSVRFRSSKFANWSGYYQDCGFRCAMHRDMIKMEDLFDLELCTSLQIHFILSTVSDLPLNENETTGFSGNPSIISKNWNWRAKSCFKSKEWTSHVLQ